MGKPIIRFKGYEDDWEQRKLGEIVSFSKGSGYSKSDLKKAGTPIILYGRLYTKYETVISEVDTFADEKTGSVYSKGGEVIVPGSGETSEDISIASVVEKPGILLGGDLNVITPPNDIDSAFLAISISNGKPHRDMAKMAQGKSVVHLHNSDLAKIDFSYPSYEEQCEISGYFTNLDNLITLHQRKCDETKKLKKYMLQNMFPQDGEKIPRIRFDGFTDDWEQRKFGDDNDLITGYPFESEKFSEDGIKLVRGMNIKRGYLDFSEEICMKWNSSNGLEKYLLEDGDILVQMDGALIGKSYARITENQLPALLVQRVTRARTKSKSASPDFMYQIIQRDFLRYIELNKTETAVPHLSLNDIRNFEIRVPNIDEQKVIGYFLTNLDNLITLHQRKCDELQKIKKFMLQNMFV